MSPSVFRRGRCRGIAAIVLLAAAASAPAQTPSGRSERADPLDAQARVPAVGHRSSLASYRRLGEDQRIDWKQANETVNRIGGWRAYTREAQQPEPPASAAPGRTVPAPAPAPDARPAHGGHKKH